MTAILNMSESLLAQGRELFHAYRYERALFLLRGLLRQSDLSPAVAAEANFLIAQIYFRQNQLDRARTNLDQALAVDPNHADSHYLLGQVIESEEATLTADSVEHFEKAYRLAPKDARKRSAYALRMAKTGSATIGLEMLEATYADQGSDPVVVGDFVEGLTEAARYNDAELVVRQATHRHAGDRRFQEIAGRFDQRRRQDRLWGGQPGDDSEPRILPFRNFSVPMQSPEPPPGAARVADIQKAGERRSGPGKRLTPSQQSQQSPKVKKARGNASVPTIPLGEEHKLAEVLRQFGPKYTARVYEYLGLLGKTTSRAQIAQINAALLQPAFLASLIRRLPPASRRALKSVVAAGGYLPWNVLFQNTGPKAPPADYIQTLIASGIFYVGHDPKSKQQLVAVVPVDLLHRIAGVLRVRLDESNEASA